MKRAEINNPYRNGWIEEGHLVHDNVGLIFTDRRGGFSSPPYDSLNLDYRNGDAANNVRANREIVSEIMQIESGRFVYLHQVHGTKIERATQYNLHYPENPPADTFSETDGVFTTEARTIIAVLTADCLPLALAQPEEGVVALLHAGWRGTIEDIAGLALSRLWRELRVDPGGFRAIMGPGIRPCCYVVDKGRARLFVEKYGMESGVVYKENGYRLDLYRANRINLANSGIAEDRISVAGGCTCCDEKYFSYRRDGVTGRQGAFIYLKD